MVKMRQIDGHKQECEVPAPADANVRILEYQALSEKGRALEGAYIEAEPFDHPKHRKCMAFLKQSGKIKTVMWKNYPDLVFADLASGDREIREFAFWSLFGNEFRPGVDPPTRVLTAEEEKLLIGMIDRIQDDDTQYCEHVMRHSIAFLGYGFTDDAFNYLCCKIEPDRKRDSSLAADHAVYALGNMGRIEAVPVLMKVLKEQSDDFFSGWSATAAESLAVLGASEATEVILELLEESYRRYPDLVRKRPGWSFALNVGRCNLITAIILLEPEREKALIERELSTPHVSKDVREWCGTDLGKLKWRQQHVAMKRERYSS